jgi:mRNA-degrading endonuclease RelE of RelBE toxin-antitoxin system
MPYRIIIERTARKDIQKINKSDQLDVINAI